MSLAEWQNAHAGASGVCAGRAADSAYSMELPDQQARGVCTNKL